jgi:hypothetical protein
MLYLLVIGIIPCCIRDFGLVIKLVPLNNIVWIHRILAKLGAQSNLTTT